MISTGISDNDKKNLIEICSNIDVKFICIDIANGYISNFKKFCEEIRKLYPNKILVAGNVVTKEGVEEIIDIVDIIKIGIGSGSACLTRLQTGIGFPQFSAILECKNENTFIISDGGITSPGDVVKAFGAGSNFVMIGGQFAGHDENPGNVIEENGIKFKEFYGMSSEHAMKKHYGKMDNYRSSEGNYIKVKYKGRLKDTVNNYLGGIRSACTYLNCSNIHEISKNAEFILVNNQLNKSLC
jgi:GMP reductase